MNSNFYYFKYSLLRFPKLNRNAKLAVLFLIFGSLFFSETRLSAQSSQTSERSKWFREARVGMIIHWGLYSIPAGVWNDKKIPYYGEWIKDRATIPDEEYAKLLAQFNPQSFNADDWIKIASDAGMKYFCLVAKHHDGFSLWDTQDNNNWSIMDTPFKRDIVGELSEACKKQGMIYSLYYSSGLDWHYPSSDWKSYKPYYYQHLKELLTRYGKIGYLWFDGEWTPQWNEAESIGLYNYVKSLDPDIITNNPKKKSSAAYGDFGLDEEYYSPPPSSFTSGLWERDRLVQNNTWAYKSWEPWKNSVDLIRDMIDAASLSMNFCLNVGPKADGSFPPEAMAILKDFGGWLNVNGESIYKTTGFVDDIKIDFAGRITKSATQDSSWYIHVFDWPASGSINITSTLPISSASVLDPGIVLEQPEITRSENETHIIINKPAQTDPFATVIKLQPKVNEKNYLISKIPSHNQ